MALLNEESKAGEESGLMAVVSVSVAAWDVVEGVAFYTVAVTGNREDAPWCVRKRYSQFEDMWGALVGEVGSVDLPKGAAMPGKRVKLFGANLQPGFLEERRVLLENLLRKLVGGKREVTGSRALLSFLNSDRAENPEALRRAAEEYGEAVEDAEITDVSVPSTRAMSDHVLFQVDVRNERKRKTFSNWTVLKRFGQFYEMDQALRATFQGDPDFLASLPPPPPRKIKLLQDHMDPGFVEERRALMENYLRRLVRIERVVKDDKFLEWMGVR